MEKIQVSAMAFSFALRHSRLALAVFYILISLGKFGLYLKPLSCFFGFFTASYDSLQPLQANHKGLLQKQLLQEYLQTNICPDK